MKNMKHFRRENSVSKTGLVLGLVLTFNMLATVPAMAIIADFAARVDPAGLGTTIKLAATVPAVANSVAGSNASGGGGALRSVMPPTEIEVTIPEHDEWQKVWVLPSEGYDGYWEWQWVTIPEHTITIKIDPEDSSSEEPIDTTTGNNYFQESRLAVSCPGLPLKVDLKYQSVTSKPEGRLGKGWHHSYEWTLDNQDSEAVLYMSTGDKLIFDLDTNGQYQSPEESKWELAATTNGYEASLPEGLVYSFTTNGILTSIHDAWDNRVTCSYGTNDCLETVAHANGRQLVFSNEWNAVSNDWRVSSIQVVGGAGLGFAYNSGGQLSQVIEQVGANSFTSSYQYADGFLTNKVNRAGFEYTYEYEEENGTLNGKGTYLAVDGYYEHEVSYADFSTDVTYTTAVERTRSSAMPATPKGNWKPPTVRRNPSMT